jgi:hypothetical protein
LRSLDEPDKSLDEIWAIEEEVAQGLYEKKQQKGKGQ